MITVVSNSIDSCYPADRAMAFNDSSQPLAICAYSAATSITGCILRLRGYRIMVIMENDYGYSYQCVMCLECEYSGIMENIQPIYCMLTHHALALEE